MIYKLGVACDDGFMKTPYIMTKEIEAPNYEAAKEVFLKDISIQKSKANDIVMTLSTGIKS